jgi:hypothetical protein
VATDKYPAAQQSQAVIISHARGYFDVCALRMQARSMVRQDHDPASCRAQLTVHIYGIQTTYDHVRDLLAAGPGQAISCSELWSPSPSNRAGSTGCTNRRAALTIGSLPPNSAQNSFCNTTHRPCAASSLKYVVCYYELARRHSRVHHPHSNSCVQNACET